MIHVTMAQGGELGCQRNPGAQANVEIYPEFRNLDDGLFTPDTDSLDSPGWGVDETHPMISGGTLRQHG